jgi:hypothetical protein
MSSDLTGQVFGRLTVVSLNRNQNWFDYWNCECSCGAYKIIRWDSLATSKSTSCGCYSREVNTTHGMTKTREFKSWQAMIQRCTNPNCDSYIYYGARGIRICREWMWSFQAFYDDLGPRPKGMTLDRINTEGNYEPGNCKWSTSTEQVHNRRQLVRGIRA